MPVEVSPHFEDHDESYKFVRSGLKGLGRELGNVS